MDLEIKCTGNRTWGSNPSPPQVLHNRFAVLKRLCRCSSGKKDLKISEAQRWELGNLRNSGKFFHRLSKETQRYCAPAGCGDLGWYRRL